MYLILSMCAFAKYILYPNHIPNIMIKYTFDKKIIYQYYVYNKFIIILIYLYDVCIIYKSISNI